MRFNEKELTFISKRKGNIEGRLQYKAPTGTYYRESVFRERYFKLVDNLLFYFRFTEVGSIDFREPAGVIVLENYSVLPDSDSDYPFSFQIVFFDEVDKKHMFTTRTDNDVTQWVKYLKEASYQYWSHRLKAMTIQLEKLLEEAKLSKSLQQVQQKVIVPPIPPLIPPRPSTAAIQSVLVLGQSQNNRPNPNENNNFKKDNEDLIKF